MQGIFFLLAVIILAVLNGVQFYFFHKQIKELIDKLSEKEKDVIIKAFPDNPEALAKDPDLIPMEEVPDEEMKKAMDKILK